MWGSKVVSLLLLCSVSEGQGSHSLGSRGSRTSQWRLGDWETDKEDQATSNTFIAGNQIEASRRSSHLALLAPVTSGSIVRKQNPHRSPSAYTFTPERKQNPQSSSSGNSLTAARKKRGQTNSRKPNSSIQGYKSQRQPSSTNRGQRSQNRPSRYSTGQKSQKATSRRSSGAGRHPRQRPETSLPSVTRRTPGSRHKSLTQQRHRAPSQPVRRLRQVDPVKAGIDFSQAVFDESVGKRCITKEEEVSSVERQKILECTHKNTEKCHYTYVTEFLPSQEEVCEENFEKSCQITFSQQAYNETVRKCYRPVEKVCNGQGPEECRTVYESSCTTKYVEKRPGKFVGDTGCEKLPVEICGAGCTYEEGEEECHDKIIVSAVQIPEEVCDLNPQKTCRFATKLVPRLKPTHQCTIVPQEVCHLKFASPKQVKKPLLTKWCLDETPPTPGEFYDEDNSLGERIEEETFRSNKNPFVGGLPVVDLDFHDDSELHFEVPQLEFETPIVSDIQSSVIESEDVNNEELEEIEIERFKTFLAEDLDNQSEPEAESLTYDELNYDDEVNYDEVNYNEVNYDEANYEEGNFGDQNYDEGNYGEVEEEEEQQTTFLPEDLENHEDVEIGPVNFDDQKPIQFEQFKTFVDDSFPTPDFTGDTFPTQDFEDFVDFKDF